MKALKRKLRIILHCMKFIYEVIISRNLNLPWDETSDVEAGIYTKQIANEIRLFNSNNDTKEDRFDPKPCIIIIDKSNMIDVCGIEQFRTLGARKRIMFSEIKERI